MSAPGTKVLDFSIAGGSSWLLRGYSKGLSLKVLPQLAFLRSADSVIGRHMASKNGF